MNYHLSRMRDISIEIENAAEFFAKKYGNGLTFKGTFFGEGLVNLPDEIVDFINTNPHEWEEKVSLYAYSLAMQGDPGNS